MYTWVFSARATAFRFTPPYRDSAALFSARGSAALPQFLYKLSFLRVQNVFFENQSNAVEFCRRHILPPEKEVVLHGAGVDLNRYIYTPYTAHDPPRFLFVGRLMREKGVEELFCAVRRLWAEGFHVHLQLLGFFEEQYRQEVDRLVAGGMTEFFGFQKEPRRFTKTATA